MTAIFRIYDDDNSGFLEREEFRIFINDLRSALYQPTVDNGVFRKILKVIDENNDRKISQDELIESLVEIYPILEEPGEELEILIRNIYEFLSLDEKVPQDKDCCYMLFKQLCEKFKAPVPQIWQIDYILDKIDINNDTELSFNEVIENYLFIINELIRKKRGLGMPSMIQFSMRNTNALLQDQKEEEYCELSPLSKKIELDKVRLFGRLDRSLRTDRFKKLGKTVVEFNSDDAININNISKNYNSKTVAVSDLVNSPTMKLVKPILEEMFIEDEYTPTNNLIEPNRLLQESNKFSKESKRVSKESISIRSIQQKRSSGLLKHKYSAKNSIQTFEDDNSFSTENNLTHQSPTNNCETSNLIQTLSVEQITEIGNKAVLDSKSHSNHNTSLLDNNISLQDKSQGGFTNKSTNKKYKISASNSTKHSNRYKTPKNNQDASNKEKLPYVTKPKKFVTIDEPSSLNKKMEKVSEEDSLGFTTRLINSFCQEGNFHFFENFTVDNLYTMASAAKRMKQVYQKEVENMMKFIKGIRSFIVFKTNIGQKRTNGDFKKFMPEHRLGQIKKSAANQLINLYNELGAEKIDRPPKKTVGKLKLSGNERDFCNGKFDKENNGNEEDNEIPKNKDSYFDVWKKKYKDFLQLNNFADCNNINKTSGGEFSKYINNNIQLSQDNQGGLNQTFNRSNKNSFPLITPKYSTSLDKKNAYTSVSHQYISPRYQNKNSDYSPKKQIDAIIKSSNHTQLQVENPTEIVVQTSLDVIVVAASENNFPEKKQRSEEMFENEYNKDTINITYDDYFMETNLKLNLK